MHDRTEWIKGRTGPVTLKNKRGREHTYANLTEFTRPCKTCEKPFSIFVTSKIAAGHADSNSFGLKNCEEHRQGHGGVSSVEVEALRMSNATMRAELTGLYERDKALFAENQVLKARLATYELQSAMAAVAKMPWEL